MRASNQPLHARFRIGIHVCGDALRPTSRRTPRLLAGDDDATMTTPGVVRGLHPETMRSVREDFFLHVPNDSRETTHGRAVSYRAFVPKGRRVVLARSLVGGRSFTRSKARGRTRASTSTGAVRSTGIVLPHRDELPARARPRVQPVRVSSTRSSPERRRREETRGVMHHRSNENIILQSTTSTLLPIRARARA